MFKRKIRDRRALVESSKFFSFPRFRLLPTILALEQSDSHLKSGQRQTVQQKPRRSLANYLFFFFFSCFFFVGSSLLLAQSVSVGLSSVASMRLEGIQLGQRCLPLPLRTKQIPTPTQRSTLQRATAFAVAVAPPVAFRLSVHSSCKNFPSYTTSIDQSVPSDHTFFLSFHHHPFPFAPFWHHHFFRRAFASTVHHHHPLRAPHTLFRFLPLKNTPKSRSHD